MQKVPILFKKVPILLVKVLITEFIMNTFNRFIITALLVFFTSQIFAVEPVIISVKRTGATSLTIVHDQPIKKLDQYNFYTLKIVVNGKTYVGNYKNPFRVVNPISPDTNGFSTVWEMPATELLDMDSDNILYLADNDEMWLLGSGYGNNPSELMETTYYPVNFSLCYQNCILRSCTIVSEVAPVLLTLIITGSTAKI
jgi:hypothetical protein